MVRGKIQMKRIESASSRHATFSKRRSGLLKKAYELSVLCEAEVGVIIFSQSGRLYDFASSNMQETLERYYRHAKHQEQTKQSDMERLMMELKNQAVEMSRQIGILELSLQKFLGQSLGSCSFEELQEIDSRLDQSLRSIRARKDQLYKEQIEQLKEKEVLLLENNARLHEESTRRPLQPSADQQRGVYSSMSCQSSDVLTELSIGLPEMAAPSVT